MTVARACTAGASLRRPGPSELVEPGPHIPEEIKMNQLVMALIATTFALGVNLCSAQNVKSDQDKAQGQEQKMQEKEKGANTPSASAPKDCKGMTGRAKEQ